MKTYDINIDGFEKLLVDLETYTNQLQQYNIEFVESLSSKAHEYIVSNAYRADELEQQIDLEAKTVVHQGLRSKNVVSDTIKNDSHKATFAEFGYGIIGSNMPYQHDDFINMSKAGWHGYDVNSPSKRSDRSWTFTDRYGEFHHTYGATPRNLFFQSGQQVKQLAPLYARNIFSRFGK